MHGEGKMTYADGVYEGEWKESERSGKGIRTWHSRDVYKGEWKEDEFHGEGIYTFADGDVYEGEWKDGDCNGKGIYTWTDGEVYEGEYKDDERNGKGKYSYNDGNVYEGEWKDGEENGKGKMTYTNGDVYEGKWQEERQNGKGTMTYTNGDVYDGEWKDDQKHGPGTMKEAGGDVYKQVYNNGERLSSKRCLVMINGPPSLRPRTGEAPNVVVLDDEDTICGICNDEFSSDVSSADEDIQKHLPVLGTCHHCVCLGCILKQQMARAEMNRGRVPKRIPCMECRKKAAFNPSEPRYDRSRIRNLGRRIPVIDGGEQSD
ncbi:hypothetical protein ACHAXR_009044 [Thalassiosira sp. AJA248-18]